MVMAVFGKMGKKANKRTAAAKITTEIPFLYKKQIKYENAADIRNILKIVKKAKPKLSIPKKTPNFHV